VSEGNQIISIFSSRMRAEKCKPLVTTTNNVLDVATKANFLVQECSQLDHRWRLNELRTCSYSFRHTRSKGGRCRRLL